MVPSQAQSMVQKSFPNRLVPEHLFPDIPFLFPILEVSSGLPSDFVPKSQPSFPVSKFSLWLLLKPFFFIHGLDWKGLVERGALSRVQIQVIASNI